MVLTYLHRLLLVFLLFVGGDYILFFSDLIPSVIFFYGVVSYDVYEYVYYGCLGMFGLALLFGIYGLVLRISYWRQISFNNKRVKYEDCYYRMVWTASQNLRFQNDFFEVSIQDVNFKLREFGVSTEQIDLYVNSIDMKVVDQGKFYVMLYTTPWYRLNKQAYESLHSIFSYNNLMFIAIPAYSLFLLIVALVAYIQN